MPRAPSSPPPPPPSSGNAATRTNFLLVMSVRAIGSALGPRVHYTVPGRVSEAL